MRKYKKLILRWDDNEQLSPEQIASDLAAIMVELAGINETVFNSWFQKGKSSNEATQVPIVPVPDALEGFIRNGVDSQFPDLGFSFAIWNGMEGDNAASLSCQLGCYRDGSTSFIEFGFFNAENAVSDSQTEQVKALLRGIRPHAHLLEREKELDSAN